MVPYANGTIQPESLVKALEDINQVYKNPKARAAMIRAAFAAETQVSIDRTAKEMIELYIQTLKD
jgi:glycogen synthase